MAWLFACLVVTFFWKGPKQPSAPLHTVLVDITLSGFLTSSDLVARTRPLLNPHHG